MIKPFAAERAETEPERQGTSSHRLPILDDAMPDTPSNRPGPTPPFRVGPWQVFPRRLLIERGAQEEKVTPKVMEALVYLASRPDEVVTKDELMEAVWPGVYVSDGAIRRTISHLRDVLDDDAQAPRYIETVATVGYRLIAPVQLLPGESTMRSSSSHEEAVAASGRSRTRVRWPYLAALVLVLLAGGAAGVWLLVPPSGVVPETGPRVVPVTTYLGDELSPSLSPNGTHLAFTWVQPRSDGTRRADLFVKLLDGEDALQLTDDAAIEYSTVWSPDGAHLAFVRIGGAQGEECGVYRIAAIGGSMRKLASCGRPPSGGPPRLSWSPDGALVAMARPAEAGTERSSIYGLSANTGIARRLSTPPDGASDHEPAFAPEGQAIAFVRHDEDGRTSILLQSLDAADPPRTMHRTQGAVWGLHWAESGRALYFLTDGPEQSAALWQLTRHGGVRERLTLPPEAQHAGDVAIQRGHLVFTKAQSAADLWRVDVPDGTATRWPSSSTRLDLLPALDPTGQRLAFFSNRSGRVSLWVGSVDGGELIELTAAQGTDFTQPAWLPRGERVAYGSSRGLFVVEVATGRVHRVAAEPPRHLAIAPDGEIYFTHEAAEGPHVRRVATGQSTSQRVSAPGAQEIVRYVDAESLIVTPAGRPAQLLRRTRAGGDASIVVRAEALKEAHPARRWAFTEDGFYYVVPGPDAAIKFFDFETQEADVVQALEGGQSRALALAADGASLIYDWERSGGFDISVVKGYRPTRQ